METVNILECAIAILERGMGKTASMLQLKSAGSLAAALKVHVQGLAMTTSDATKLTALV